MAKTRDELISKFHEQFGMYDYDHLQHLYTKLYSKLDELLILGFEVIRFTATGKFHLKRLPNISVQGNIARLLETFDGDEYLSITFTHKTIWVAYHPRQEKEEALNVQQ